MMMTKPAPEASSASETTTTTTTTKSTPADAVQDLERRLQMLETTSQTTATTEPAAKPVQAPPAATTTTAAPTAGKNPLLARIMAAQERAKQGSVAAPAATATATTPDLLDSFDTPTESAAAAPPAFDASLLPPQPANEAPPAFDALDLPPPPPQQSTTRHAPPDLMMDSWDPMAPPPVAAAPAASAPVFEDLLEDTKQPPSYSVTPVAPPSTNTNNDANAGGGLDQEAIDAILGIEGLSDEEKAALIAEQEKILASIEQTKTSGAAANSAEARANAFEQRSHAAAVQAIGGASSSSSSTKSWSLSVKPPQRVNLGGGQEVALHGQDKTHAAIKDGTAIMMQCLSCENWMQVTKQATMMLCPVCQTVNPVAPASEDSAAASQMLTDQELAERLQKEEEGGGGGQVSSQMLTDQELAEQLQKEEYKNADKRQQAAKKKAVAAKAAQQQSGEQGWMDWIMGSPSADSKPSTPDRSFAQRPLKPGEIGVSLPPGASRNNAALSAAPAYTGRDSDVGAAGSSSTSDGPRWSASSDPDGFDNMDVGGGGAARVAESKPLFNCVADSISSAANQMYNAVSADEQGNVHGVDGHGLLAMSSNAGRNSDYQNMD